MKKTYYSLLLAITPFGVLAQTSLDSQVNVEDPSRWRVGLGLVANNNGYVGRGTQVTPIPLVAFEGERFYLRGITAGVRIVKPQDFYGFGLDAIISPGFGGINAKDFSQSDLAHRGINRDDLEDRGSDIDVGFRGTWTGAIGQIALEATTDVSGNSKGQQYGIKYGYAFHPYGFAITPSIGVKFLSSKVADYYYGIHKTELQRGVSVYKVGGGAAIPEVGVNVIKPFAGNWTMIVNANWGSLPSKISNSPLVSGSSTSSIFIGFARSF